MLSTHAYIYFTLVGILILLSCWTNLEVQARSRRDHFRQSGEKLPGLCEGRRILMHDLPPQFNTALLSLCGNGLAEWMNFCPHIENGGLGQYHVSTGGGAGRGTESLEGGWYKTDPYMLEVVFHSRMQKYPCLTRDASKADAFYLPYYAGIDALRYLYNATMQGDKHGDKLVEWIKQNAKGEWDRYGGRDHFMVLGRTSWDFYYLGNYTHIMWGTGLFYSQHMANITSLIMEAKPWMKHEQAIPYLTSFHPSASELKRWIGKVRTATRTSLFSFAGATRSFLKDSIRDLLLDQCSASSHCTLLNCALLNCQHNPEPIAMAFMHSSFCLQPRGDTPTRRSTFDSMISGCIPVFFHNDSAYTQYTWHLPEDPGSYSVFISEMDTRNGVLVEEVLRAYTADEVQRMREKVISIIPKLVYASRHGEFEDAFEVSVQNLLSRTAWLRRRFRVNEIEIENIFPPPMMEGII